MAVVNRAGDHRPQGRAPEIKKAHGAADGGEGLAAEKVADGGPAHRKDRFDKGDEQDKSPGRPGGVAVGEKDDGERAQQHANRHQQRLADAIGDPADEQMRRQAHQRHGREHGGGLLLAGAFPHHDRHEMNGDGVKHADAGGGRQNEHPEGRGAHRLAQRELAVVGRCVSLPAMAAGLRRRRI